MGIMISSERTDRAYGLCRNFEIDETNIRDVFPEQLQVDDDCEKI